MSYQNSKLTDIENQLAKVHEQASKNIESAINRGEAIDQLANKSVDLETNSLVFRRQSKELSRMEKCKYYRNNILCFLFVLLFFGLLIWAAN